MPKPQKLKTEFTNSNTEQNVCVTCSTKGECENVFILTFEDTRFSKIFNSCMGFQLSENSSLKYMCLQCIDTIISFHTFKETALKSYKELCKVETASKVETSSDVETSSKVEPTEKSEHFVFVNIDDPNLVDCMEAESDTAIELEIDIKKELTEKFKEEVGNPLDKSDKESSSKNEIKLLSNEELKKRNVWQCSYCNIVISKDNPAGIKKHRYAEKVKRIKIHECPVCHKTFTKTVINEHILRHGKEKPVKCKVCGKGVSSNQTLKQHMMLHDGKKFVCDICDKGFTQQFLLKEHMPVHDNVKTFLCPTCGLSFPNPTRVRQHQYKHKKKAALPRHGGDLLARHICDFCGKKFSSTKTLEIHRTKHDSDKQYECARCGKIFGHRALLTSHIWLHIAEFRCQKCFQIFQKDDLRKHDCVPLPEGQVFDDFLPTECRKCGEILQHGNIDRHLRRHEARECEICGLRVFGARKFKFHLNNHKLKCELCGKGFAKKQSYLLHTKNEVCVRFNLNKIKKLSTNV